MESEPFELNQNDGLEFGIDIMDENGACKVSACFLPVVFLFSPSFLFFLLLCSVAVSELQYDAHVKR